MVDRLRNGAYVVIRWVAVALQASARQGDWPPDRKALFIVFEQLFVDPIAYGFANVWTPDPARTATTALFWGPRHFGERGYELIAEVYRHHLTWGRDRDDVLERVAWRRLQVRQQTPSAIERARCTRAASVPPKSW